MNALINDLVVNCSLPLPLVENDSFRNFLHVMDNKYTLPARATIQKYLENKVEAKKEQLKKELQRMDYVNATVDIWFDRKKHGYLVVTVHFVLKGYYNLKSGLLAIERFTGSHSGDRISTLFDLLVENFEIHNKIKHIITDNAANMKKAFMSSFPFLD